MIRHCIFFLVIFWACKKDTTQTEVRSPWRIRLEFPDSLQELKKSLLANDRRYRGFRDWPFVISDSASDLLRVNDSARYTNDVFQIAADSLQIASDRLPLDGTIVLQKEKNVYRLITRPPLSPRIIFRSLFEFSGEIQSHDGAIIVRRQNNNVFVAYRDQGQWVERFNIFKEKRSWDNNRIVTDPLFIFHGEKIAYDVQKMRTILSSFGAHRVSPPSIYVYPDYESKAQVTNSLMEYTFDFSKSEIHLVHTSLVTLRFFEIVSIYYAYKAYGEKYPWLCEGLGIYQSGSFFGKDLSWWEERKALLHLADKSGLLELTKGDQNPFLLTYLSVLFWKSQNNADEVFKDPAPFLKGFNLAIPDLPDAHVKPEIPFFKGFCYAHSNGIHSGYTSKASAQSLLYLQQLGVNGISVTPFGYSPSDTTPDIFFVLKNDWDETMGGLFKSAEDAHALGMSVMMKPHLWIGNGQWCGEVHISTGAALLKWEKSFTQFVVYHALIAELAGMESMCLGCELPHMSRHTEMFKRVIRNVRTAFHGYLTYGGNWFDEYDQIQFWDDLDFIGMQQYFPLSEVDAPTENDARGKVLEISKSLEALSKKWGRAVVFTEAGFPSTEKALHNPHMEDFSQDYSEKAQAMGYRILFDEFYDKSWFRGFFWWKWESAGDRVRTNDKSFQIRNKEAESIVKSYYSK